MKALWIMLIVFALMYLCVSVIMTLSILIQYAYFRITGDDTLEQELTYRINEYEDTYFRYRERNVVNYIKLMAYLNLIEPFALMFVI